MVSAKARLICRLYYTCSMYSGARALLNRLKHYFYLPKLKKEAVFQLNQKQIQFPFLDCVELRVFARPTPPQGKLAPDYKDRCYGMLCLVDTSQKWLSQEKWQALSSHFGCAHFECAFYSQGSTLTVYATRNFGFLPRSKNGKKMHLKILLHLNQIFSQQNIFLHFAHPDECLDLAIDPRLLDPLRQNQIIHGFHKKYQYLHEKFIKS